MKIITMMYLEVYREYLTLYRFFLFFLVIRGILVSLALPTRILVNIPVMRFVLCDLF